MNLPQFTVQTSNTAAHTVRFVLEPLPQGYGHTLGNSLRRILYTSINGAAITSVQVKGASHQFTVVDGGREDIVTLVLNLKQVRLAYNSDKPAKINLTAKGPGEVKAGDFTLSSGVTVANPNLVIAHLADKNSKLELEATVESGTGYSPAEDRKGTILGLIPMDAVFSPVVRVNFAIEATRVGRLTNYDRLVLDVITDGTVTPQAAVTTAAQILVDYFQAIATPQTSSPSSSTSVSTVKNSGSSISVEELDLPTRIANALQKAGFETVANLLSVPRTELAKVKNVGVKSVKIIEIALRERGIIDLPQ